MRTMSRDEYGEVCGEEDGGNDEGTWWVYEWIWTRKH